MAEMEEERMIPMVNSVGIFLLTQICYPVGMKKNDFVEYIIHDVLKLLPNVSAREMFGGYGVYQDRKFFSIIVDDVLYFRVDDSNRKDYEKHGSEQFFYQTKKGPMPMNYWNVPEEVMEDPKKAATWAKKSLAIKKGKK
jgi:DNA transformation protein